MHSEPEITGAEALIKTLIAHGVTSIFGYPGGAIMPVYDVLPGNSESFNHVLVRHEQGAVHAAEGYARITGKVGVCMVTSGPGATNLVTGIADAMLDSVPLVCITGQVVSDFLGTDAFQETDVIGVTLPITKWNYQITNAAEIPSVIARAFSIATEGRPGPVVIDITKDAQTGRCLAHFPRPNMRLCSDHSNDGEYPGVAEAADLINASEKPLLLVGNGVRIAGAEQEVLTLAETSEIPAGCTLHGLSSFPTGHRLYAGMLGMHGNYAPNMVTNEADLLIAVGMRFDDRVTGKISEYGKNAKVIHIEVDPAEINKVIPADVALVGDARKILQALLPHIKKHTRPGWLARLNEFEKQEYEKVIGPALSAGSGAITMSEAIHRLSELSAGEAVVVSDVGQHQMMAARYYRFKQNNSWITSGGLGTMGFALPAAIGAKHGCPEREVIAVIGDGGFQMTLQELGTIAQEGLPVIMIILNNNYLGMVRQWQELFFDNNYSSVQMHSPDYVKLCDAYGIAARSISEREDLDSALTELLASEEAFCLEIKVEKKEKVFPMLVPGTAVNMMRLE